MSHAARRFAPLLLVPALGACAPTPSPVPQTIAAGALALVADAFAIVERQYAVAPSFADVRHGAFQGLERALPPGTFAVGGGRPATVVSLRLPGEPAEVAVFSGATQDDAVRDLAEASHLARRLAPDVDGTRLEHAMIAGALGALDPFSGFLAAAAHRRLRATITHDVAAAPGVSSSELAPGLGYVRIGTFDETTERDVRRAIETSERPRPLTGLVLDLRDNSGGVLSSAVAVAEQFLQDGELILCTEGRLPAQPMRLVAHPGRPPARGPIAVLVNDRSASASEILAGALQDHGRAVVLGSRTAGKGSIQTIVPLRDGSALRLTTAYAFTPTGRPIHRRGITPDVVVTPTEARGSDVLPQRAVEALAGNSKAGRVPGAGLPPHCR